MPLISLTEMLADARKNKYAVGCFNVLNLETIIGILEAAEEERSPVILSFAEVHQKYISLDRIGPIIVNEAKQSSMPVGVILDHGMSFSTAVKAMKLGFNSVMFDGSRFEFSENVSQTREIVKIADALDVDVEGEIGYIGRPKSASSEGNDNDMIMEDTSYYTTPEQAKQFAVETGVDMLAVAFGTAHGIYLKMPKLDFKRLENIAGTVDVPLVMHGGSGLTREDFRKSIECGISKINYYTNLALEVSNNIKRALDDDSKPSFYHDIIDMGRASYKQCVKEVINMFGSNNRVR